MTLDDRAGQEGNDTRHLKPVDFDQSRAEVGSHTPSEHDKHFSDSAFVEESYVLENECSCEAKKNSHSYRDDTKENELSSDNKDSKPLELGVL